MKKLILLFLLITTGLFAQITRAPLWTLSGTTLSPLNSTYGIALGGAITSAGLVTGKQATFGTGITAGLPFLVTNKAGSTVASIDSSGNVTAGATAYLLISGRGGFNAGSDANFSLENNARNAYGSLHLKGITLQSSGTGIFTMNVNASDQAVFAGASGGYIFDSNVLIGAATAVDTQSPDLIITGDADSDGTAFTTEALTVSLTSNATPTLATWAFTSTQSAGYTFDKAITVTGAITSTSNISTWDSLTTRKEKSQLADSLGVITLATGVAGWGEVMAGDNQEWASFRFSSDGTVTLITNTANVMTTVNSVDKLNIYDAGTGVVIQNNLGASKKVAININYFIP